jgi:hypothetical protein
MQRRTRGACFAIAALLGACGGSGGNADHTIEDGPELAGRAVYEADLDGL